MKKYSLILIVFMVLGSCIAAQDTNPNMSRKTETTINGKPYSQYKAEQEALKKQKITQSSFIVRADDNSNGGTGTPPAATARITEETAKSKAAPVSHKYVSSEQNAAYTEVPTQNGKEGRTATPVESAVVKAPVVNSAIPAAKAPVPPAPIEEKSADNGNSTNGEKPAQVPTPKQQ